MIKAKNGVVTVTGYTHELMKEMVGIIYSALEGNFLGETLEKRVTMLNTIIKMVKGNVTVICGGKKVVTDADGIGKIIADMVADELKNDGREKK